MKKTTFTWIIRAWILGASVLSFIGGWIAFSHSGNPASSTAAQASAPAVSAPASQTGSVGARIRLAPSTSQSFGVPFLRSRGS